MIRLKFRRTSSVSVAIGAEGIWAVPPGQGGSDGDLWSCALTAAASGGWTDLTAALSRMTHELGIVPGRLHLALLPPLVQVRRVELPRLPDDTLRLVLSRDSARYFPGVRGAQVIATTTLSPPRRSPATYLVTTADAAVLESVFASVADAGWNVKSIVSAYSAWEAGARRLWPELARSSGEVAVSCGDRVEVLQLEGGRVSLVRRFAAWAAPAGAELSRSITSSGVAAARSCEHAAGPELLPDRVRLERRRSAGRLSAKLLAASAALLVLTAGIEAWGAGRELGAVQRRRAALEENVAGAMQVRDQMSQLDARLRVLAGAEAGRSQWARTLVSIAEHLPTDAHLVGFRGSADSLVLEGEAERAGLVFESLQKAPGVVAVRADAPIRQEARDSGPAVERFTLAARLAPR